jgi:lipoate-protein ligase A
VTSSVTELYDYEALRSEPEATMFVVQPLRSTVVLGSAQSIDLLDGPTLGDTPVRRRRGGGGLVLLQPDDIWVDWWIPASDSRWSHDVHVSSLMAGTWWAEVLREVTPGNVTVHDGPLEGDPAFRLVCFAGRGPGEVFVDARKAVGVTQWRVREGIFLSSVVHARASGDVLRYLNDVPAGLDQALHHQVLSSLTDVDPGTLIEALALVSGPWQRRSIQLHL